MGNATLGPHSQEQVTFNWAQQHVPLQTQKQRLINELPWAQATSLAKDEICTQGQDGSGVWSTSDGARSMEF